MEDLIHQNLFILKRIKILLIIKNKPKILIMLITSKRKHIIKIKLVIYIKHDSLLKSISSKKYTLN